MGISTIKKIESILNELYSTKGYLEFISEVFPGVDPIVPVKFCEEYSNFNSHIKGYTHIGTYKSPDKKTILIMSVELNKSRYVENARSTQRSYAKKLIENAVADAALIAFYTEGSPKWRLSFVRLDYEMKIESGKLKTSESITPARRYSYLVGKDEPCHTAISRFGRFITDSLVNPKQPTLDDLEEAFSVEKITDEFFNLYCEKFYQLQEQLESNEDFLIEAEQHNYNSAQFAKKLLGQIVFLYFLQKKGWLGVGAWPETLTEKEYKKAFFACGAKSRELIPIVYKPIGNGTYKVTKTGLESISDADEEILAQCVKGKPWGSGPHNFMRILFEHSSKTNSNFYDDFLEPLFYDALNVNRGESGYCPALHCRIPFLSGGLFEPMDGYDWKHNNFAIPNEIFSNETIKGKREVDGILDIFDRYNFTISEDEPLEREVAIDPEMLGKVFENLLEIKDRKSKGAFYTPREIVHFMCQESLVKYLTDILKIDEDDIREFILHGDFMKDEDTVKDKRQGIKDMYISDKLYKVDKNGAIVVNRLDEIDRALKNIRIADPAVGSGAFPLGMLNEIVRLRQNISAYFAIDKNSYDTRIMYSFERSPYSLKYETIKNCIFAADIDPSAVDITRLRLWLSLVIDDEINPEAENIYYGHRNPNPLPNLECNVICGNSLLDKFEGIRLINESSLIGTDTTNAQINMNKRDFEMILEKLIEKQEQLFKCENIFKKQQLIEEIDSLRDMIIMSQLQGRCDAGQMQKYQEVKKLASKSFIPWQLYFASVFKEKGGFDIVIGNPPYVQLQKEINETTGEKLGDQYKNSEFECFAKTGDIYCLFYEKGYKLLHKNGILTFITSNKWMRASYGKALREFLAKKTNPLILIDFAGQKIFESATVDVNILMFSKSDNNNATLSCIANKDCRRNLSVFVNQNGSKMNFQSDESWTILSPIEQSIKRKIEAVGTPLKDWDISINYGIKTGLNEAFIISGEKKDKLIAEDPKSAEIIRPILRGRDIKRYGYEFADLWLITTFPSRNYDINDYPAIRDYLLSVGKERLEQTGKTYIINGTPIKARKKTNNQWFETQDSINYWNDFSKPKIIFQEMVQSPSFTFDEKHNFMCLDTGRIIVGDKIKYLTALLNSSLFFFAVKYFYGGGGLGQSGVRMKHTFFEKFHAIVPTTYDENYVNSIVEQIILNQESINKNIFILDQYFFEIYNLNKDEINFILNSI